MNYDNIPTEELIRMVDNLPDAGPLLKELVNRLDKALQELKEKEHA